MWKLPSSSHIRLCGHRRRNLFGRHGQSRPLLQLIWLSMWNAVSFSGAQDIIIAVMQWQPAIAARAYKLVKHARNLKPRNSRLCIYKLHLTFTIFSLPQRSVLWPKICQNAFAAWAQPRTPTPMGELTTLPRPPSRLRREYFSQGSRYWAVPLFETFRRLCMWCSIPKDTPSSPCHCPLLPLFSTPE